VSTREQRATEYLANIARHIDSGTENLNDLATACSKANDKGGKRMPYDLAWEYLDLDVAAVVRKDAGRLLRAVEAALKLAQEGDPVSPAYLREAIIKTLLGEDLW